MNSWIDVKGGSGAIYRYQLAEQARPRTAVSGNYIYLREGREPKIVFAGQSLNLAEDSTLLWQRATAEFGATHLYYRLNVAGAAREAELADLLSAEVPPMNEALQAAED